VTALPRWALSGHPTSAAPTGFPGAKSGASNARLLATPDHIQPESPQVEGPIGRRLTSSADGTGLYGMRKVRGSNPLSSTLSSTLTFSQFSLVFAIFPPADCGISFTTARYSGKHPTADDVRPQMAAMNPMGEAWLKPEYVTRAVMYLVTDPGRTSGAVLEVSLGMSAARG